jgi:hypothetical protein
MSTIIKGLITHFSRTLFLSVNNPNFTKSKEVLITKFYYHEKIIICVDGSVCNICH